jgi:hypothetical protein
LQCSETWVSRLWESPLGKVSKDKLRRSRRKCMLRCSLKKGILEEVLVLVVFFLIGSVLNKIFVSSGKKLFLVFNTARSSCSAS